MGQLPHILKGEFCQVSTLGMVLSKHRSFLTLDLVDAGMAAVVFGHSHKPLAETLDDVLYLNPGSAGPQRFRLPITVARLYVSADRLRPRSFSCH